MPTVFPYAAPANQADGIFFCIRGEHLGSGHPDHDSIRGA